MKFSVYELNYITKQFNVLFCIIAELKTPLVPLLI